MGELGNSRKFVPLFIVQFFAAMNDNILRSALLVFITYAISSSSHHVAQLVTIATFMFVLPFFLFSSYAGKLADTYSKVRIIRIIKFVEIVITVFVIAGFLLNSLPLLFFTIFALGIHSAFFGPIKYSILPQYVSPSKLLMANAYIETGTFIAILLGEVLGSSLLAEGHNGVLIGILMLFVALGGCYFSFKMQIVPPQNIEVKFYKNFIKDAWLLYKKVTQLPVLRRNLHAISWFWGYGSVYLTQLPIFTRSYLGGNGYVFSLFLAGFSIAIGVGSICCAKISRGIAQEKYVVFGVISLSIVTIIFLILNYNQVSAPVVGIYAYVTSLRGVMSLVLFMLSGFFAGFYSVTSYNQIQLKSPDSIRSQVISANNILNAVYMVLMSVLSFALLHWINTWQLLLLTVLLNFVFCAWFVARMKE